MYGYLNSGGSEPACFGTAPDPGIFNPEPAPAPGKIEQKFRFFKMTTNCLKYVLTPVHIGPNLYLLKKIHQMKLSSIYFA